MLVTNGAIPWIVQFAAWMRGKSVHLAGRMAIGDGPPTIQTGSNGMHIPVMDIGARRREYFVPPPFLLRPVVHLLLKDARDAPLLYMLSNVVGFTLPFAYMAFCAQSHVFGFVYWLCNTLLFQERFILGMHYFAHRGLFRIPGLDAAFAFCMTPFFGLPGGLYHLHHVVMHHVENNLDGWDLSSTERFQRDSLLHFLTYWARFLVLIWFELPMYALRRNRYILGAQCAGAVSAFFVTLYYLYQSNPVGTMWVFAFPTLANSFLLMLGNWCQHMFIDPDKPRCNYHLAFNVINHPCNQRSFNDGYHVEHHVNSRKHWSELPASFMANIERYRLEDAIVFQGLDNLQASLEQNQVSFIFISLSPSFCVFVRVSYSPTYRVYHTSSGWHARVPRTL